MSKRVAAIVTIAGATFVLLSFFSCSIMSMSMVDASGAIDWLVLARYVLCSRCHCDVVNPVEVEEEGKGQKCDGVEIHL